MIILIISMVLILLLSCTIVFQPFLLNSQLKTGMVCFFTVIISATFLYLLFSHGFDNLTWLHKKHHHQQLIKEFNQLGSIDEIIARVQRRIRQNPDDAQGYYILAKLYEAQGKQKEAEQALIIYKELKNGS